MLSKSVIVEAVSKKYYIGETKGENLGPLAKIQRALLSPLRRASSLLRHQVIGVTERNEEFWALQSVSFEVSHGEVVGIIGRNGAGKSTLLKLLSHITSPSSGRILSYGRVASLLEVGTGFHPELTGRENIYLNGTIMGMKRLEIDRKFDEIVDFAGVEKFVDTPVKHYSSGMYVRLGFAVAANLEPDILIVDEVLSVGDTAFQKKCLAKMKEQSGSGRTVLFVSHSLESIARLCPRTILLEAGKLVHDGPTAETIRTYLQSSSGTSAYRQWLNPKTAVGDHIVQLRSAQLHKVSGEVTAVFNIQETIQVSIEFDVLRAGYILNPNFHLFNQDGICIFVSIDRDSQWQTLPREIGRYRSTMTIPGNLLSEGTITINLAISNLDTSYVHFNAKEALAFQVIDNSAGDAARGNFVGNIPGIVRPVLVWKDEFHQPTETDQAYNV